MDQLLISSDPISSDRGDMSRAEPARVDELTAAARPGSDLQMSVHPDLSPKRRLSWKGNRL